MDEEGGRRWFAQRSWEGGSGRLGKTGFFHAFMGHFCFWALPDGDIPHAFTI